MCAKGDLPDNTAYEGYSGGPKNDVFHVVSRTLNSSSHRPSGRTFHLFLENLPDRIHRVVDIIS